MYHPSFIHASLCHFKSKSRAVCCMLISRHKAIIFRHFKTLLEHQDQQEPSRTETNPCCPSARTLDPSPIKAYLGCCKDCITCVLPLMPPPPACFFLGFIKNRELAKPSRGCLDGSAPLPLEDAHGVPPPVGASCSTSARVASSLFLT